MTEKQAAEILRTIAQQNLPTVNGIPFTEIKKALILGASELDPVDNNPRPCDKCKNRAELRSEYGTIYGCKAWKCDFEHREG